MANVTRFAIEGKVDGIWAREHVGAADDTTLFDTESEAVAALDSCAAALDCSPVLDLRVVEVQS